VVGCQPKLGFERSVEGGRTRQVRVEVDSRRGKELIAEEMVTGTKQFPPIWGTVYSTGSMLVIAKAR
jgi:hypothetical protein